MWARHRKYVICSHKNVKPKLCNRNWKFDSNAVSFFFWFFFLTVWSQIHWTSIQMGIRRPQKMQQHSIEDSNGGSILHPWILMTLQTVHQSKCQKKCQCIRVIRHKVAQDRVQLVRARNYCHHRVNVNQSKSVMISIIIQWIPDIVKI